MAVALRALLAGGAFQDGKSAGDLRETGGRRCSANRPQEADARQQVGTCILRSTAGAVEQPLNQRVRQTLWDGARERWRAAGFRFRGSGVRISPGAPFRRMTDQANLRIREKTDMKKIILALAILYPAAAFAQGTTTPAARPHGRRQAAGRGRGEEACGGKKRGARQSRRPSPRSCRPVRTSTTRPRNA